MTAWAAAASASAQDLPRGAGEHLPGTVLALVAALLFGLGSVLQHEAAARAAAGGRLRMRTLVRQRTWLLGQVATTTGTGAQVAALALAPVALVQPLLAGALVAALGVRAVRARQLPSRTEWAGAVLTVGGLVVFVVAARPGRGMPDGPPSGWAPVVAVALVVLAVAATARLGTGPGPALACGVTGGLAAGVAAVLVSAALTGLETAGVTGTLVRPALWGAVVASVASQVGAQQAYGRGSLNWSLPALVVFDPLTAVPAARLLLDEHLEPGRAGVWGCAALVAVVGVVLLTRSGGQAPEPAGTAVRG
ncbi:DMT family transporter [Geodermatophilus aquaeductus]|uniref:Magnesium transporter NIPA n=1 Tax=Geodermatophilus aquaeductus TaxID=1564161 RepID=A0A521E2S5_9ACTN|nr:DMT family transporter [Geodermatophilus aquaeductus]SMO78264.1 Magnesium transporter NIPA [Geodermatophilus aquaeductus]